MNTLRTRLFLWAGGGGAILDSILSAIQVTDAGILISFEALNAAHPLLGIAALGLAESLRRQAPPEQR